MSHLRSRCSSLPFLSCISLLKVASGKETAEVDVEEEVGNCAVEEEVELVEMTKAERLEILGRFVSGPHSSSSNPGARTSGWKCRC